MRKAVMFLLTVGGMGFGAGYLLFNTASAEAGEPRSAIRFSTGNRAPAVITSTTATARVNATGAIVVPAGAPTAFARGDAQVSYLPNIEYAPHGRTPQVLPPGVIAQSDQLRRFRDRRFNFTFLNNSVIPNQSIVRPVQVVP